MSSSEDKCYATVILIGSYDEHITPNAGAPRKIELNESKNVLLNINHACTKNVLITPSKVPPPKKKPYESSNTHIYT